MLKLRNNALHQYSDFVIIYWIFVKKKKRIFVKGDFVIVGINNGFEINESWITSINSDFRNYVVEFFNYNKIKKMS